MAKIIEKNEAAPKLKFGNLVLEVAKEGRVPAAAKNIVVQSPAEKFSAQLQQQITYFLKCKEEGNFEHIEVYNELKKKMVSARLWWFFDKSTWKITFKYGVKFLDLNAGEGSPVSTVVAGPNTDDILKLLNAVQDAVNSGDLDKVLNHAEEEFKKNSRKGKKAGSLADALVAKDVEEDEAAVSELTREPIAE